MTKQSSPAGSGRGRRGPVREGYKVVALLLKPSLGLFGLVGRRRVLLLHPGSASGHLIAPGDHHTLQHIQVHFGVDFQADFEDVRWHDMALTWNYTKDHNRSRKLCFRQPGRVPVIRGNPAMHFEGAGNGPVVISWISREDELYSGASPISLVEPCVTFGRNRRLLSLLGFVHNWPTSRWSATKKENRFSLNGNGIMSYFLGQKFYRSTLYYMHLFYQLFLCPRYNRPSGHWPCVMSCLVGGRDKCTSSGNTVFEISTEGWSAETIWLGVDNSKARKTLH